MILEGSYCVFRSVAPMHVQGNELEFGTSALGGFVVGKVFELGFVCCFRFDTDDSSGIVWGGTIIERETRRAYKRHAPVGRSILGRVHEEGCEGMDLAHIFEWDDHEDGQKHLSVRYLTEGE